MTASSGLATLVLEVIIVRLALVVFRIKPDADIIDFAAVCGYKYVGYIATSICCSFLIANRICVTMVLGIVFGVTVYYAAMITLGIFMGFFMVCAQVDNIDYVRCARYECT